MGKSMTEMLRTAAPPPSPGSIVETVADIDRILALPSRPPVDCERDLITKKYKPAAQALIEIVTGMFTRGPRVSCACRERTVRRLDDGTLLIFRASHVDDVPEPPKRVAMVDFEADLQRHNAADMSALAAVRALQPGQETVLPSADVSGHPCITMLNAVQAWFLWEAIQVGGVVGFCGVGSGKSIAFLLAAQLFADVRLSALLIEPKQRQHYRSQYLRLREHFKVTSIVFDDGQPGYIVPGTKPLHLISYSVVSRTVNSDLLDQRNPDQLMLDEGHRACGDSAINRRVRRYCADKIKKREQAVERGEWVPSRAVRLLVASGTLEVKSVEDTQMVCAFSLGTGSPLPVDPNEATRWSDIIDPIKQPDRKSKTARVLQRAFGSGEWDETDLMSVLNDGPEKAIREGFRRRRLATPGIISASAATINAAMYLTERKAPKMPPAVRDALMKVRTEALRPDGVHIEEKVEQISTARHVACGFYQYWAFPKHPCSCGQQGRCDQCMLIDDWYMRRKFYAKEERSLLRDGLRDLDSPELCREAARRAQQMGALPGDRTFCADCWIMQEAAVSWPCKERTHRPAWDAQFWAPWSEIEDQVEYEEREKWIEPGGDFLAQDAAKWALDEHKGVVWFQSIAFGRRVQELTGLPYFNGGPGAETRMRREKGDRSIIVSIKAHGAGTDGLQNIFHKQLICETPASNATQTGYEQLLGRLHREGQRKDEVFTEGYFHVREMKDALRQAIRDAEFNYEMTGNKQKLLCADVDVEGV